MPIEKISNSKISDTAFKDLDKTQIIDVRKERNDISKRIKESKKVCSCLLCQSNQQLINSHTVPRAFIENIAKDGKILNFNFFIKDVTKSENTGVNNSNTFRMLCSNCDSSFFNEYENCDVYSSDFVPTQLFLRKIALKSYLRMLSCKYDDYYSNEEMRDFSPAYEHFKHLFENDIKEYNGLIKTLKKEIVKKDNTTRFKLIYNKNLPYIIPCAFQGFMGLVTGFDNETINNLYLIDKKHTSNIYICAFPLKNTSQIIVFHDMYNSQYKQFDKKFNELSDNEKLNIINQIILLYSNDLIISSRLQDVELNYETKALADRMTHSEILGYGELPSEAEKTMALLQHSKEMFKLEVNDKIFNFLLEHKE